MRRDRDRLEDIVAAAAAVTAHLVRGGLDDGMVFDAVRVRLIEIGEAAKDLDPELLETEPDVPWPDIARMRDHLTHRRNTPTHQPRFSVIPKPSFC